MSTLNDKDVPALPGTQTLHRGLAVLMAVAESEEGLSTVEVAELTDIHRTIAHRALQTLMQFELVQRTPDGRYTIGLGSLRVSNSFYPSLRSAARPLLQAMADETSTTACLFIAEADTALALMVVEPRSPTGYHLTFRAGNRHPLSQGSAGHALQSLRDPSPNDPAAVRDTRARGFAMTFGEVEPGAWGISVPRCLAANVHICVHAITVQEQLARAAVLPAIQVADGLTSALTASSPG